MSLNFKNKKVLVMGLGLHGGALSVVNWLHQQGANIRVTDLKSKKDLASTLKKITSRKINYILGKHRKEDFLWADMIIQNPDVPATSEYLKYARENGATIENEATLFFKIIGTKRIIGITGTRGKSTTASLLYAMLKKQYPETLLGGNIATRPMFDIIDDAKKKNGFVVLELSSAHLENLGAIHLSPHIAIVTNLLPDHLNRYKTLNEYFLAKQNITKYQQSDDISVLNADNKEVNKYFQKTVSDVMHFSHSREIKKGAFIKKGTIILKNNGKDKKVINVNEIVLKGVHNIDNILAALTVAHALDVPTKDLAYVLRTFVGIEYRQQIIRTLHNITFVNDTTATTPDATIFALKRFEKNIILIAGGSDKNIPTEKFKELAKGIKKHCKAIILFEGEGSKKIKRSLSGFGFSLPLPKFPLPKLPFPKIHLRNFLFYPKAKLPIVQGVTRMDLAVDSALRLAEAGDTILLSPACASFGLFENEFDRGDRFNQKVKTLK